jgi:hypothetical protein
MEIGALPIRREIEEPEGYVLTPRDKDLHHSVLGLVAMIARRLSRFSRPPSSRRNGTCATCLPQQSRGPTTLTEFNLRRFIPMLCIGTCLPRQSRGPDVLYREEVFPLYSLPHFSLTLLTFLFQYGFCWLQLPLPLIPYSGRRHTPLP